jgi:hypothetical protein
MEDHYVFGKLSKQWRPITKKMVNILINSKSRESAIKAAKIRDFLTMVFLRASVR